MGLQVDGLYRGVEKKMNRFRVRLRYGPEGISVVSVLTRESGYDLLQTVLIEPSLLSLSRTHLSAFPALKNRA